MLWSSWWVVLAFASAWRWRVVVASAFAFVWGKAVAVELSWSHCVDGVSRWLLCAVVRLQSLTCVVELVVTVLVEVE